MIQFVLNDKIISTDSSPGLPLLDLIRYERMLTGTKIGCREGDCGACTVLAGSLSGDTVKYESVTSCLMATGNAAGKHIVTVEGINTAGLNFIQQAFAENGATQCGFCTPGFIVSLAGYCLTPEIPSFQKAIDAVNGNICRCTGYKSIERAIESIAALSDTRGEKSPVAFAVEKNILPSYFLTIPELLQQISTTENKNIISPAKKNLGGGTDLYVQQHATMPEIDINFLLNDPSLKFISQAGSRIEIGGATTVADIAASPVFKNIFPALDGYIKLVSSTQIRNMATIAGNYTNASPIGDFSVFFLALNAKIKLSNGEGSREIFLKDFYKGYKQLDKHPDEIIRKISFETPAQKMLFNFEKVCKRTWLDIASVNTAISITMEGDIIRAASLSAGGVSPVPLFLEKTGNFLHGKAVTEEMITALCNLAQTEIAPISDARGTAAYKRFLLSQLIKAHFIKLFPALNAKKLLTAQ